MVSSNRLIMCKGFPNSSVVLLGVIWLLLAHQAAAASMKNNRFMRTDQGNVDLNFMSIKRRVPNGPDPIHNRGAGNSRQPHDQVSEGELGKP